MNILLWIILGGVAGWIASLLTSSDHSIFADIILGVLGALLGGWLMSFFGNRSVTGFNLPSLLVAVVGAVILILISRAFRRGTRSI